MILAAVFSVAAFAVLVYCGDGGERVVLIEGKDGAWVYPLDGDRTVSVSGPLGETVIRLEGGAVRVVSSPCGNQTCVAMGPARRHGDWLACLPNMALLTVEGGAEAGGRAGRAKDATDASTW